MCLGIPVYDADSRAKALMASDDLLKSQIAQEFGPDSFDESGSLNRKFLAAEVFSKPHRLEKLNSLVHPRVGDDYQKWASNQKDSIYVLKEAALLFESGSYRGLDKIVVVSAPMQLRLRRTVRRDSHRTTDQIREIMERQLPEDEKIKRADYVISNDEETLLIPQVIALHQVFRALVH
jgi:dephospho-CoA kinase